jgi:hypothetical protein
MSVYYSMLRAVYTSRNQYALGVYFLTAQIDTLCLDEFPGVVNKAISTSILLSHVCLVIEGQMEVLLATI